MEFFIQALITFIVVIDPIGTLAIFIGLTSKMSPSYRRHMAIKSCLIAWGILILFAFVGQWLLESLGVSIAAFRIAGGIFLFLIAFEMLFDKRTERKSQAASQMYDTSESAAHDEDISVFPLAMPLLAGPGAITAVLLFASRYPVDSIGFVWMLSAFSLVMLTCTLFFYFSGRFEKIMGETFNHILTRLLGMLLAALACQFVLDGIINAFDFD